MRLPVFGSQVDKLSTVPGGHYVFAGSFRRVTAVVEPVYLDVRRELLYQLAVDGIISCKGAVSGNINNFLQGICKELLDWAQSYREGKHQSKLAEK